MKLVEGIVEIDSLQAFLDRIDEIAHTHGCTVQVFDARYVVSEAHLGRAVELADRAIRRGDAVARERGVEIMLYAAGTRQIDRALTIGVAEGTCPVVVLVDDPAPAVRDALDDPPGEDGVTDASGTDVSEVDTSETDVSKIDTSKTDAESDAADAVQAYLRPATTLGEYDPERVRSFFEIGTDELDAVDGDIADLVLERVALLDVEK